MRKILLFCLALLLVMGITFPSYAWTLPDIKNTFSYKVRARELSLGVSFELWQQEKYSLELQLANNFIGISILRHWIPLVEISSGFALGYDPHLNQIDYAVIIFAWIAW